MQTFWEGGECANLGFGTRTKKIGFIGFKVYNVALYVEADPAKATLHLSDSSTDSVCSALLNGQFEKVLQIHMLRDVTSTQFKDGLRENLIPNLKKYGGNEHLETFMDFFSDKKIGNGSEIPLLWSAGGELSTDVFSAGFSRFTKAKPGLRIASEAFCKALFDIFLSPQSIVQDGRKKWTASAVDLVDQ